jgi:hypothetical protein
MNDFLDCLIGFIVLVSHWMLYEDGQMAVPES